MKRWLLALLVTLAVIVLVSPGIIGRLAERRVAENLEFAASESEEIRVTTESFDRGWFNSEGQHRIELRQGSIRALFEDGARRDIPSLIIETHVDHGLVPLTSVSRESGSLMPALASTVSTVKIDSGSGQEFEVPGKIYSHVGLTGETTSRLLVEAGSRQSGESGFQWQGADFTVWANPASGTIAYEGELLPLFFFDQGGGIRFGAFSIEGEQLKTPYGFRVGNTKLELESLAVDGGAGTRRAFGRIRARGSNELEGDRVNGAFNLNIDELEVLGISNMGFEVDVVFRRLDARSLQGIITALKDAQASTDPQRVLEHAYPRMESDLHNLLQSGLELRIDQLDLAMPDGDLTTKLRLDIPAADPAADFSWPALILALDASADVRMPAVVFEMAQAVSTDVGMLVATGVLKKVDDYYEMKAEYSQGLVTVNGAPMPIPLQGL